LFIAILLPDINNVEYCGLLFEKPKCILFVPSKPYINRSFVSLFVNILFEPEENSIPAYASICKFEYYKYIGIFNYEKRIIKEQEKAREKE
jgi:hypothetical protein